MPSWLTAVLSGIGLWITIGSIAFAALRVWLANQLRNMADKLAADALNAGMYANQANQRVIEAAACALESKKFAITAESAVAELKTLQKVRNED